MSVSQHRNIKAFQVNIPLQYHITCQNSSFTYTQISFYLVELYNDMTSTSGQ